MYDKKIFSVDGTFRFGKIEIDSHDIFFGTVAMAIVDALIRRAKRQSGFFVVLEQEGPEWVLAFFESSGSSNPRFLMFEDVDKDEDLNIVYHINNVSLKDFAERVVFDLSYPDFADVYTPELGSFQDYFRWDDLKAKVEELKALLKDEHAFDRLSIEELCHCEMLSGASRPIVDETSDGKRAKRDEAFLNDYGMRTVEVDGEWFLLTLYEHEIGGPYASRAIAQNYGMLHVDDVRDVYREIPNAECRAILEKDWSYESARISKLRDKGFSDRAILCALNPPG